MTWALTLGTTVVMGASAGAGGAGLQAEMEAYLSGLSAKWGSVGVGVGYVDATADFGIGVGLASSFTATPAAAAAAAACPPGGSSGCGCAHPAAAGCTWTPPPRRPFTANDTVVLGSGTKPYVAAAVMRLVDAGRVALADTAATHIDRVMQRLWNTTFVGLLGAPAVR